jgi:hypothetical protein
MRHRRIQRAALLAGAALLGAHFSIAAFSQAPLSPAKIQLHGVISGYLEPYFTQNWSLFAPDPTKDDQGIVVRAKCADGAVTDYYDVTGPLIKETQEDRFFPSRTVRLVSNGLNQLNDSDDLLWRLRQKQKEENGEGSETKGGKDKRDIALTQINNVCPDGTGPTAVQARMYIKKLPPWSQRKNAKAKSTLDIYDLPWKKAVELQ